MKFFICVFFLGISLVGWAHTVVLSEYRLVRQDDGWILSIVQSTTTLVNEILNDRPDLKGINLNSEVFLESTYIHFTENIKLINGGKHLTLTKQSMSYTGVRFEASFLVKGLSENPEFLTFKVDGFDDHEQSVKILSIMMGDLGYVHSFNKLQRFATFDFDERRYLEREPINTNGSIGIVLFCVIMVFLIGLFYKRVIKQIPFIP